MFCSPGKVTSDGGVSGTRTAAPLTADALRWLLLNQRSRRQRLVAVARYVPPRGERESVLRVDWRTQLQGVELRSSRAALCDSRVPLLHRLATHHTGLLGCSRLTDAGLAHLAGLSCGWYSCPTPSRVLRRAGPQAGGGATRHPMPAGPRCTG